MLAMEVSNPRPLRRTLHTLDKQKVAHGNPPLPKDVKNEGRSGNVYENKGSSDKLPEVIAGICAQLKPFFFEFCGFGRTICPALRLRSPFFPQPTAGTSLLPNHTVAASVATLKMNDLMVCYPPQSNTKRCGSGGTQ